MRFHINSPADSPAPARALRRLGDQSWHENAACAGMEPTRADALFFPAPSDRSAIAQAKKICAGCPVRRTCLDAALESETRMGIRGGLTEGERHDWHKRLEHRVDARRVAAVLNGRDIHITLAERKAAARMAVQAGISAETFRWRVKIDDPEYAIRLLREARRELGHLARAWGIPSSDTQHDADIDDTDDWGEPDPADLIAGTDMDLEFTLSSDLDVPADDCDALIASVFPLASPESLGEAA
ncbi:WhiB family transcriptional regulator [Streptomyces sp. NPDC001633]|uniref:WhiB family transcriptional regulator n=1 Tax=Streptomyces sp. NPDC001633 TaxID=3364595 RepID=UPI0036921A60